MRRPVASLVRAPLSAGCDWSGARLDERGLSLSVWTAVAMPAFIIAVGLGVDFSGHAAAEQEARAIAAEAARAATHAVSVTDEGQHLDPAAARRAGQQFADAAGYTAHVDIGAMSVDVTIDGAYETVFLGLIGIDSIGFTVTSSAVAVRTLDGAEA